MITRMFEISGNKVAVSEDGNIRKQMEYYGKSTDTKPTKNVKNADAFYEMDTMDVFLFDEESGEWLPQQ